VKLAWSWDTVIRPSKETRKGTSCGGSQGLAFPMLESMMKQALSSGGTLHTSVVMLTKVAGTAASQIFKRGASNSERERRVG